MNQSHHATLVFDVSVQSHDLTSCSENFEVIDQYYEKFGIDDARELVKIAYNRPRNTDGILLIVRTEFITHEAQNALLKILEEPPVSTKFIFVLPPDLFLLPTLLSRFDKEGISKENNLEGNKEFQDFLAQDYGERIFRIDQAVKKKDINWQRAIKRGLINFLSDSKYDRKNFERLEYTARVLLTRGASNKMLLENVALILKTRS